MSDARRVKSTVKYNNRDISHQIISIGYTDNTDNTDDISIKLSDRAEQLFSSWFPETGDTLTAKIELCHWISSDTTETMNCGLFEVDNVEMSDTVTINAVSVPITGSIRSEKKNKGWENINLSSILEEITGNAGLTLVYETDIDPYYDRIDQNNKSDLSFIEELCKSDGLCLKISDGQLIVFEESKYDTLAPVGEIIRGTSLISGVPKFKRNAKNIYTACEISFTDSKTDKTYKGSFNAPNVESVGHVLKLNESFNSESDDMDLERKAKARLREQNKKEWTADVSLRDGIIYYAGTNIELEGWYSFDGKYHIQSVSYNISSSGFTTNLSLRKCLEGY